MNYTVWERENDVQLIPEGEEDIHAMDVLCGCKPFYHQHNRDIVQTVHQSFFGEDFGQFVFTPIRQKKDC